MAGVCVSTDAAAARPMAAKSRLGLAVGVVDGVGVIEDVILGVGVLLTETEGVGEGVAEGEGVLEGVPLGVLEEVGV